MNLIEFGEFKQVMKKVNWRSVKNINYTFIDDINLREPFLRYILIEYFSDKFSKSLIDIFYNKYFWFSYFIFEYEEKFGEHSELLQQRFQILEPIDNFDLIDLKLLEQIERNPKAIFMIKHSLF